LGFGDIFRNYSASRTVISVDKARISAEAFIREYSNEKQNIKNNSSPPLTDKELKNIDIKEIVIENIINRSVFEQIIRRIGIVIPKRSIFSVVQSIPDFQVKGAFSERVYEDTIRRSGVGEGVFLAQIRDHLEHEQLLRPLVTSFRIPAFIREQIAKEFETEKTLLVAKLALDDIPVKKDLSDDEVKQYYEINKDKYKIPECRDLSVLVIDCRSLAGEASEVDPAEVEARFQETRLSYDQPETRDFERFSFETKKDADKAWNMINAGESSITIKKKFAIRSDIIRGIRLSDLPEQFGKDLFELTINKTSSVCSSGEQFHVYRLVKINAPKMQNKNEIKKQIREEILNERLNSPDFYEKVKSIKNEIDDGFGSGNSIDEIAKKTGLKFVKLKSFARSSREMEKIVKDEATRNELIQGAFDIEENQATQIIESKEDDLLSYVVYVKKINKADIPQFEKISGQVKSDYIAYIKEKEASKTAQEIVGKGNDAASDVKKLKGVKIYKLSKKDLIMAVQRQKMNGDIIKLLKEIPNPNLLLGVISTTRKGEAINCKLPEGGQVLIAVQDVSVAVTASDESRNIFKKHLESGASNDIISVIKDVFKEKLEIEVNRKVIEDLTQSNDKSEEND
jgi:peptidyl-prolyl cis-trans isomerase D